MCPSRVSIPVLPFVHLSVALWLHLKDACLGSLEFLTNSFSQFPPTLVNCIENVKRPRNAGRPVLIELDPNFELLAQMRNLQITFLEDEG